MDATVTEVVGVFVPFFVLLPQRSFINQEITTPRFSSETRHHQPKTLSANKAAYHATNQIASHYRGAMGEQPL
jgi:hypothetical protein